MDYTIMGDSVNLAARLEGVNKEYKSFSMISMFTKDELADQFEVRELDQVRVVGKNEPIQIFELLGAKGSVSETDLKAYRYYHKGLELYRKKNFAEAKKYFVHCVKLREEDGPSRVLHARCKEYESNPPKTWDGVYNLSHK